MKLYGLNTDEYDTTVSESCTLTTVCVRWETHELPQDLNIDIEMCLCFVCE